MQWICYVNPVGRSIIPNLYQICWHLHKFCQKKPSHQKTSFYFGPTSATRTGNSLHRLSRQSHSVENKTWHFMDILMSTIIWMRLATMETSRAFRILGLKVVIEYCKLTWKKPQIHVSVDWTIQLSLCI